MNRTRTLVGCCFALLLFAPLASRAGEKGWFGLVLQVDASGIFHPVVHSIKIGKVLPASPAARAGLDVGDLVLEVQGVKVAGAAASQLQAVLQTSVGQILRLKIKHGTAPERELTLRAEPKPPGQ